MASSAGTLEEGIRQCGHSGGKAANETKAMVQALSAGEAAMTEFLREPSRKQLWNMQTAAMSALLADHRLRTLLL